MNSNIRKNIQLLREQEKNFSKENFDSFQILYQEYLTKSGKGDNSIYEVLCRLSSFLNLPLDKLIRQELTPQLIIEKLGGKKGFSYRYNNPDQKLSSLQGMKNVLNFLEGFLPEDSLNYLLKEIECEKSLFKDSKDRFISSLIPYDFFNKLSEFGFSDSHFLMMGENTAKSMPDSLKEKLAQEATFKHKVEHLIYEIIPKNYDHLYSYKILKLSKKKLELRIHLTEGLDERFQRKLPTGPELSTYLTGAFQGVLKEATGKNIESNKTSFTPKFGTKVMLQSFQDQETTPHAF